MSSDSTPGTGPAGSSPAGDGSSSTRVAGALTPDRRVLSVHRIGALAVAAVIGVIGVLGVVGGLGFFDTTGSPVLGLSTNGLLSTISIVTALVLVVAALRGGKTASTIMIVVGVLFLLSAFGNLAVMNTSYNLLAFRLPNVFFSIGAGLVLLVLGSYGRVSSKLPANNPYQLERQGEDGGDSDTNGPENDEQPRPATNAEHRADREMADAARAAAAGSAGEEQRRRLEALDGYRTHEQRRRRWMELGESSDQAPRSADA